MVCVLYLKRENYNHREKREYHNVRTPHLRKTDVDYTNYMIATLQAYFWRTVLHRAAFAIIMYDNIWLKRERIKGCF